MILEWDQNNDRREQEIYDEEMKLKQVETYKYLGTEINQENKIKELMERTESAGRLYKVLKIMFMTKEEIPE